MIYQVARARTWTARLLSGLVIVGALFAGLAGTPTPLALAQANPRFFAETGFTVSNDAFWNYFQHRGGLRTFGYPVSREFQLEGFCVQFFQRQVMQLRGDNQVQLLNLLDTSVLPYTQMNGSTFPGVDQGVLNAGPNPADPAYGDKVVDFVRGRAPDTWNGRPVNFGNSALSLVTYNDVFPDGLGPAGLVPLMSVLELTGMPSSAPALDPNNNNFVYQRFQRVVLQYDATTNTTNALLLADYLKAVMTGENLPADLEAQAKDSKYFRQYDRHREKHLARPEALPNTDLTNAFEREDRPLPILDLAPKIAIEVKPDNPTVGTAFTLTLTATDDLGLAKVSWNAENSGVPELDQAHDADCGGATSCVKTWNVVSRVPGTLSFRSTAIDTSGLQSDLGRTSTRVASSVMGVLETPTANAKVGGNVVISGYALDKASTTGTGVQAVHVYLDGDQAGGSFLGAADYGQGRNDIGSQLGDARFGKSGFSLTWDASKVTPGDHTINVFTLSAVTGRWDKLSAAVTVVPRPFPDDPVIRIMEPYDNAGLGGAASVVKGWAVDRNAPTGTGVDKVEVWFDGPRDVTGSIKLGEASYGNPFGSPGDELGDPRFAPSGFLLAWSPLQFRAGTHTLYVYVHSVHTDVWVLRKIPITIQ